MSLEIGNKYSLSLERTFGGYISLDSVILRGKLDLSTALGLSNVIDDFEQVAHTLPTNLRDLDLSKELWYYFTTFEQETKIIVPHSFVLENTITLLSSVTKSLKIEFAHHGEYQDLVNYLSDYGISFVVL